MRRIALATVVACALMGLTAVSASAHALHAHHTSSPFTTDRCGPLVSDPCETVLKGSRPTLTNQNGGTVGYYAGDPDCVIRFDMQVGDSGDGSSAPVVAVPSWEYDPNPALTSSKCASNQTFCDRPWDGQFTAPTHSPADVKLTLEWCMSFGIFGTWRGPVTLETVLKEPQPNGTVQNDYLEAIHGSNMRLTASSNSPANDVYMSLYGSTLPLGAPKVWFQVW